MSLEGKVVLVTGASRGAGRAIAIELGKLGATVYVTGRSTMGNTTNNWPGSVDETAEEIDKLGGKGIPVKCDHRNDDDVERLIKQVYKEKGRIDILVNNVWGGHDFMADGKSLKNWDTMFTGGVRAQLVTNHYALPLMKNQGGGVVIHPTFWDDNKYTGWFYYDLAKNAINRMVHNFAIEYKYDNITVLAVSPGWMRTEIVLAEFNTSEEKWHEVEPLKNTESPFYIGRAVSALATDPNVRHKSGQVLRVSDLAKEFGFTDIDGRTPPAFHVTAR